MRKELVEVRTVDVGCVAARPVHEPAVRAIERVESGGARRAVDDQPELTVGNPAAAVNALSSNTARPSICQTGVKRLG